jgi:hypothetical protein
MALFVALYVGIYLNLDPLNVDKMPPMTRDGIWGKYGNALCSVERGSKVVPVPSDTSGGFNVTLSQCMKECKSMDTCHTFSYYRYMVGLPPLLGGKFGEMRCTIFLSCVLDSWRGGGVWVKDGFKVEEARKRKHAANVFPSVSYLAPVAINLVACCVDEALGLSALGLAMWALYVAIILKDAMDPLLLAIIPLTVTNAMLVLAMHCRVVSQVDAIAEEEEDEEAGYEKFDEGNMEKIPTVTVTEGNLRDSFWDKGTSFWGDKNETVALDLTAFRDD